MNYGMFEGREITDVGAIVRKTGDGLSATVEVEPDAALGITIGDEGYIVFKYQCVDVHHPAVDRKRPHVGGLKRVPILDAATAVFLDGEFVGEAIDKQQAKIDAHRAEMEAAKAAAKGTETIDGQILIDNHENGEHATERDPNCAKCREEIELEEAGK